MKQHSRTDRAFTLIELLAVIGIIGVLAALLLPAIKTVLLKSEITQAQTGISNLSTAFKAYYTEYGKWPISDTQTPGKYYVVDANMVALLLGTDVEAPLSAAQPATESGGGLGGPSGTFQGNPHRVVFLQFQRSDIGNVPGCSGCYLDPWKKPYFVDFDFTYANTVPDPFDNTLPAITTGFLVWSDGPDGQENQICGDPPGPWHEPPKCVNRDNVKSW